VSLYFSRAIRPFFFFPFSLDQIFIAGDLLSEVKRRKFGPVLIFFFGSPEMSPLLPFFFP